MDLSPCDDPLLLSKFGVAELRPAQRSAFDALARGRDVLVVMPTGGGKSLCYQFPATAGLAPAIVVSPLVALMKDQVDALVRRGIAAARLSSTATGDERASVWNAYDAGRLTLIYVAPEALENATTVARLAASRPRLLAVDEAHCISEWGESFRPSYLRLTAVRHAIGSPPTIALTATATPRTRREIIDRLKLTDPVTLVSGFDRPNLHFGVEWTTDERSRQARFIELARDSLGAVVCYTMTRRDSERLAATLNRCGVSARAYHAGLPASERSAVQDDFLANRMRAIVATCAFGMGVDKPDVRLVLHLALPSSLESYYQEAGRAGRDGTPGRCVLLRAPGDDTQAQRRAEGAQPSFDLVMRVLRLTRHGHVQRRPVSAAAAVIATALGTDRRLVGAALRILTDAESMRVERPKSGTLRLIALEERIARDRTLPRDDLAFVRTAIRAYGSSLYLGKRLEVDELRALDPSGEVRARLDRLAASQVICWTTDPDVIVPLPGEGARAVLDALERQLRRQQRDVWRLSMVRRFVDTTRCRRRVMLRYFGDGAPGERCGGCDTCDTSDATR